MSKKRLYIRRLATWNEQKRSKFFNKYPSINTQALRERTRAILMSDKKTIEKNFRFLKKIGIINGIGPGYIGSIFRWIITGLFKGVRYEFHDIQFAIFGSEEDFHLANYQLLDESYNTTARNFEKVMSLDIMVLAKLILIILFFLYSSLANTIAGFCYIMVEIFGRPAFSFDDDF